MNKQDRRAARPTDQEAWVTLEISWLKQLTIEWRHINHTYFREALSLPMLQLSDSDSHLGLWELEHRTLRISRKLCHDRPWGSVVEVLKHEMAHQYVHEVLRILDEPAHGPAFRSLCERHGIDASSKGEPENAPGSEEGERRARLLRRVTKLLALAESQNQNEAQSAMSAAQKLMLEHNLEMASSGHRRYGFRHLGEVKGRIFEPERRVSVLLGEYFFVEAIWVPSFDVRTAKKGSVLEVCGAPENLDMAEYVHGFLFHRLASLWREHKLSHALRGDRERLAFFAGVVQGFADTLAAKRKTNKEEGLIWLGDADLVRYLRSRHPRVSHTHSRGARGGAREHGREAGRKLVLNRPVHAHAVSRGLLGSRS